VSKSRERVQESSREREREREFKRERDVHQSSPASTHITTDQKEVAHMAEEHVTAPHRATTVLNGDVVEFFATLHQRPIGRHSAQHTQTGDTTYSERGKRERIP
jgi:uncharacterized membrane protein YcjF (UPF0283 family)